MYRLEFTVETLSPAVISATGNSTLMTGSHSEISGSIVRGILAARYVREKNLGDAAYLDKNFLELFYGDLKFLAANPKVAGLRSFTLPLSLQRGKTGTPDEKNILDLLKVGKTPPGYKSLRGYGAVDGDKIFTASIQKNILMHMSRSEDAERKSGKSEFGHIYNYEALDAGQIFSGAILGEKSLLERLQLENTNFTARLGRSKFTQYGSCRFTFGEIKNCAAESCGAEIYLRLESALVGAADYFIGAENFLQAEVVDALNESCGENIFSLGKIFAGGVEVENFVVPWGMKRPRVQALAAGSVFELKTAKTLTAENLKILREKMYGGFGTRTEEGFGQMRFWQPANFTLDKPKDNLSAEIETFSAKTQEIAGKILRERFLEQYRIYAHEDATNLKPRGNTHFFSRLDNLLSNVGMQNVRAGFAEKILAASKDASQFQDNLKKIYLHDRSLYEIFTGGAPLPYEGKKFSLGDDELFKQINFKPAEFADEFCFEYLQRFLRFARKNAKKGGGEND